MTLHNVKEIVALNDNNIINYLGAKYDIIESLSTEITSLVHIDIKKFKEEVDKNIDIIKTEYDQLKSYILEIIRLKTRLDTKTCTKIFYYSLTDFDILDKRHLEYLFKYINLVNILNNKEEDDNNDETD